MDLNVRDFPDDLQRQLKSVAALKGITMRQLITEMLQRGVSSEPVNKEKS